jgi:hypothetical protein
VNNIIISKKEKYTKKDVDEFCNAYSLLLMKQFKYKQNQQIKALATILTWFFVVVALISPSENFVLL